MTATPFAVELTVAAARAAAEKKAEEIIALDVSERLALTDVFLVVSGRNDRHVRAIVDAVEDLRRKGYTGKCLYMSPRGKPLTQQKVRELAAREGFILLCGHYEGVDERALELVVDEEISLGDFVLTGGELAAMAVVDAVARLVPGVLGSSESAEDESFSEGLLEYPQYTRPREYRGLTVPEVLLNGDHAKIRAWRRKQALAETLRRRPDLFATAPMTDRERAETLAVISPIDTDMRGEVPPC